jgi:hypothetical protein
MKFRVLIFAAALSTTSLSCAWAADSSDACKFIEKSDLQALAVTAQPKSRNADSPHQAVHSCVFGSLREPPMLSVMVQQIKMPIAVDMGHKKLAEGDGEKIAGPWDIAKLSSGADGMHLGAMIGSLSIQVLSSRSDAKARETLIAIAKRVASAR